MSVSLALVATAGYLLGSLPWGYWLPRLFAGVDVRKVGSGNTGAANVWRTVGFRTGFAVALLDIGKGFVAALLGLLVDGEVGGLVGGVAAMAGHWRPLFMGFRRGGKIVATTVGVALPLVPLASVATAAVWLAIFLLSRYTSVASMVAAAALPVFAALLGASTLVVAFTTAAAVAIVVLHRANIGRLLAGTENRFDLRRRARLARSS